MEHPNQPEPPRRTKLGVGQGGLLQVAPADGKYICFASTTVEGKTDGLTAQKVRCLHDRMASRSPRRSGRSYPNLASERRRCTVDGLFQIAERELAAALPLIHPALEIFYDIYDEYDPVDDGALTRESETESVNALHACADPVRLICAIGTANKLFISKTYDATSHFETAITDVLDIYRRIMGKELVLTSGPKRE